ncbi:hypothetical protein FDUTEX481_09559 [Tolypothrix sp. PCC 7601]|nr:hypothetical protein FDUTEX481_09559 [Tolypothrix sp. PCC 7601]BAY91049.1 hypothetical protein NIES3275_30700 [Microchaete diplosiphon NIES-3275]
MSPVINIKSSVYFSLKEKNKEDEKKYIILIMFFKILSKMFARGYSFWLVELGRH